MSYIIYKYKNRNIKFYFKGLKLRLACILIIVECVFLQLQDSIREENQLECNDMGRNTEITVMNREKEFFSYYTIFAT